MYTYNQPYQQQMGHDERGIGPVLPFIAGALFAAPFYKRPYPYPAPYPAPYPVPYYPYPYYARPPYYVYQPYPYNPYYSPFSVARRYPFRY